MKMRSIPIVLATAAALAISTPAIAGPVEDFDKLMDDYWATQLKESPLLASRAGVPGYDAQLDEVGVPALDRQTAEAAEFLKRLNAIPASALSPADQTNHAIMYRQLESAIDANRFGQRMIYYSSNGSLHNYIVDLITSVPLRTQADYDNYLARLSLVKSRIDAYGAMSAEAARKGYGQPCVTVSSLPQSITGVVASDPSKSRFYEPFTVNRPTTIDASNWAALQARARDVIATQINPAYTNLGSVFSRDVLPRCLKDISVSAMPQGKDYYAYLVRTYTTTDRTPDQIHELGLKEVARIRSEMDDVAHKAGFANREAMITDMRTNPKYFAKTPEELLAATALMAKTIDGKMPSLFTKLPRLPYGIKPIPAETAEGNTTAYYQDGSPDTGRAGTCFVKTTHLNQRH
jgi:uncharacterized protein (DUF885 family)